MEQVLILQWRSVQCTSLVFKWSKVVGSQWSNGGLNAELPFEYWTSKSLLFRCFRYSHLYCSLMQLGSWQQFNFISCERKNPQIQDLNTELVWYSGDPKTRCVRFSNGFGQPRPFYIQFFTIKRSRLACRLTKNVRFSNDSGFRMSGFRIPTVFEWLKSSWMPNGLVFECHLKTRQPNYLNTDKWMPSCFLIYWSSPVLEWSVQYIGHNPYTDHLNTQPFEIQT